MKKNNILITLLIIIGLLMLMFIGYKVIFDKNSDNNESLLSPKEYDICVYRTDLDAYMVPITDLEKDNFSKKYELIDGIKFANNDGLFVIEHPHNENKYILYYDKELILYNIANKEKSVIDVNVKNHFNRDQLDDIMWFVNEDENGKPVGLAISFPEWNEDGTYNKKGFYYDLKNKKTILENKYLIIRPTNNSNYLQLSLSIGQGNYYHEIFDIKNNKVIFSLNPSDYSYSDLNIYEENGQKKFLGYNFWGHLDIFDEQKNIVKSVSFPDCCDVYEHNHVGDHYGVGDYDLKTGNYVLPKDNKILTYDLEGDLIKSTEQYDKICAVTYNYSIVENNGYFVIIKNDGTFKHNIGRIGDFNNNIVWLEPEHESDIVSFSIDDSEYMINIKTNKIMKVE